MQLDRYVIVPAACYIRQALRLALEREGWEAVFVTERPSALLADEAALAVGDVVLAWRPAATAAGRLRKAAADGDAAALLFRNYDEQAEGAQLADLLTGAAAQAICPEHGGGSAQMWNVQPHGGREPFFEVLAGSLARLGGGTVLDPYAAAHDAGSGRHWRRLIQSSLPNPLFPGPAA